MPRHTAGTPRPPLRGQAPLSLLLLAALLPGPARAQDAGPAPDREAAAWMQAVLDGWESVARRHLRVAPEPLAWTVFYDDRGAWHLAPDESLLPAGHAATGTLRYAGSAYPLVRVAHEEGRLWVPGREPIRIADGAPPVAAMVFGAPARPFSIVPLPALYRRLAGADQAAALDELFLGMGIHELTHTRHLPDAAPRIRALRERYDLPGSIDDNLLQSELGADTAYRAHIDREGRAMTRAILAEDAAVAREAAARLLAMAEERRRRFFVGGRAGYAPLEDLFLVMEGVAMWAQYQTARDRAPAGEEWLTTLVRLSERTDSWSQAHGLGLFLLIDRLAPGWQPRFMAAGFPSPFAVLREAVERPGR